MHTGVEVQDLLARSASGVLLLHADGSYMAANEPLLQALEYSDMQLRLAGSAALFGDRAAYAAFLAIVDGGVSLMGRVLRMRKRGGGEHAVFASAKRVESAETGALITYQLQDVSSDMVAIDARNRSLTSLSAIVDSTAASIITVNREGIVTQFNKRAEQLLGYRADEVIGKLSSLVFHDPLEVAERARAQSARTGSRVDPTPQSMLAHARPGFHDEREWTYVHRDGTRFPVLLSITPQHNDAGEVDGMVGVALDVRKAVIERNELVALKREAEQASEAKARLVAYMTHELRNPVQAVMGMTTLLLESELGSEQRNWTEMVRSTAGQQLALINDMLEFSKIEAGHIDLQQQPFVLQACVDECLELLASAAFARGTKLTAQTDAGLDLQVCGDVSRLRQVLVNLVSNAIQFGHNVHLHICRDADAPEFMRFVVSDDGPGVSAELLPRLFAPFEQALGSAGGTGLGLAISQHLVRAMGGSIQVQNAPTGGARFEFTALLPALDSRPPSREHAELRAQIAGRCCLIILECEAHAAALQRLLEHWGAVVEVRAPGHGELLDLPLQTEFLFVDLHLRAANDRGLLNSLLDTSRRERNLLGIGVHALGDARWRNFAGASLTLPRLQTPFRLNQVKEVLLELFGVKRKSSAPVPRLRDQMAKVHPLRILVAEDNPVNQKVALLLLEKLGYRADTASSGAEVLQAVERANYDVILMDLHMPQMNGLLATQLLRARAGWQPRIVATTATEPSAADPQFIGAGMDDYLPKPIALDALVSTLRRARRSHKSTPHVELERSPIEALRELVPDAQAFTELILEHVQEARILYDRACAGARASEFAQVQAATHNLRSSSAMFGATELAHACRVLEKASIARDLPALHAALPAFEGAYARASSALDLLVAPASNQGS